MGQLTYKVLDSFILGDKEFSLEIVGASQVDKVFQYADDMKNCLISWKWLQVSWCPQNFSFGEVLWVPHLA